MKISWGQFMALILLGRIFTLMTCVPFMSEDYSAMTQMGAIAISTAIQAAMILPLLWLSKKYPEEDFFAIIRKKSISICIIVSSIYYLYAILTCIKAISHFMRFAETVFFPTVNPVIPALCFLAVCAYGAWLGVEAIARTASTVLFFFVAMAVIMCIALVGEAELFRLYPEEIINGQSLLTAVLDDFGRNGEILLAVFLLPNIRGGLRKGFFGGLAGKVIILEVITVLIITALGGYVKTADFPLFSLGSYARTNASWRFDAVYLIVWTMTAAVYTGIFLAAAGKILRRTAVSKTAHLISGAAVFLGCLVILLGGNDFLLFAERATGTIPLAVLFFAIPLILLIGGDSHGKTRKSGAHRGSGADSLRNTERLPEN